MFFLFYPLIMLIRYNPNKKNKKAGDCVIRAISKVLNKSWMETYINICIQGSIDYDMPSGNDVWGNYLIKNGFKKHILEDVLTVKQFTHKYPVGTYVLCTGSHVVACIDGDYFDAWDSGEENIIYYYKKG